MFIFGGQTGLNSLDTIYNLSIDDFVDSDLESAISKGNAEVNTGGDLVKYQMSYWKQLDISLIRPKIGVDDQNNLIFILASFQNSHHYHHKQNTIRIYNKDNLERITDKLHIERNFETAFSEALNGHTNLDYYSMC